MFSDTLQRAESLSSLTLRTATLDDLPGVLALLAETAGWLNGRGIRQWPAGGFPAARIEPLITAGTLYVLDGEDGEDGTGGPAATMALDDHADPEFWRRSDHPETGLYVHKLAVRRAFSGRGLGETLLDWAALRVAASGRRWLRLDCSKDNPDLQGYYSKLGFRHVRTVDLPHRASGALFQRAADPTAHAAPRARRRVPSHVRAR
ncbi:GNAT family N-acetyltransferase [Sphaerisporangium album]|uniref:GNAT family N-acetyltransferase n=1 Tax=Sphaerisporangium album TaxID=509200 RepID=A0A367FRN6_9ACTN|nr:GNAT family N-acetyltransferase [Sphaerisporangium album]RCG32492.1 GNAT family N-acetyltransferase [Sphaerisporangium album]